MSDEQGPGWRDCVCQAIDSEVAGFQCPNTRVHLSGVVVTTLAAPPSPGFGRAFGLALNVFLCGDHRRRLGFQ